MDSGIDQGCLFRMQALGLNWDSVNFNSGYIVIQRSFRAGYLSEETKTGSNRTIPVDGETLHELDKLKTKRNKSRLKGIDGEAVFVRKNQRLSQNSFRYTWKRILERSGIEYRKTHTIRDTGATKLLNNGFPTKLVAELLGHTIQTLLTTYSHETKDDERKKREMILELSKTQTGVKKRKGL
jgi:integrase